MIPIILKTLKWFEKIFTMWKLNFTISLMMKYLIYLCYVTLSIPYSRKISDLIFMQEIRNIDNIKYWKERSENYLIIIEILLIWKKIIYFHD